MRAVLVREFGGPEVLRLEDVPTPEPGPGELVFRVHAVSVNRTLDLAVRAGEYGLAIRLPHILGVDPSGVVTAVGDGVADRKPGDRVAAIPWRPATAGPLESVGRQHPGGYAEFVKLPAAATVLCPPDWTFQSPASSRGMRRKLSACCGTGRPCSRAKPCW